MRIKPSQYPENQQEFFALKNKLRNEKQLIHKPAVQKWLKLADDTWDIKYYNLAVFQLNLILKFHNEQEMCAPDEFRPHCPESLSRSGNLHLLDQMDGIPIFIDHNKLVTGLGIFGPQGSGKSYTIVDLCSKLRRIDPNVRITLIDAKGAFSYLTSFLHIDMAEASFDSMPQPGASIENHVYESMPVLAQTGGLIYGLELLSEASDISLEQRRQYIQHTNIDPGICLKDILESLNRIKVSGFRTTGYRDAAATVLSLIIGRRNLFSCRKGISLDWLFNQNVVLNARCITNEMECRYFITFLLYWLYQRARFSPETNQIKHVIVVDDATRFIGTIGNQFDGNGKTSPLGHILAVLRSAGICLIYATQLPAQVDSSVLSLTRNALVVGNINGEENLRVIQNMLSLSDNQKAAIPKFKQRETLAFISGSDWPYHIHGWTPNVNIADYTTENPIKPVIDIVPWHSLTDIPQQQTAEPKPSEDSAPSKPAIVTLVDNDTSTTKTFGAVDKLVLHCINNPFVKASEHANGMNSDREYDAAKNQAVQEGLLIQSASGKSLYLIPSKSAYEKFGMAFPYERAVSVEHSFYIQLAVHTLRRASPLKVQAEVPIGTKGATIDITTTDKSGNMTAIEVTLTTSNLSSNASKLQDTAYKKIVWLCRDADTAKAVKAYFNKLQTLPLELVAKFEYIHLSKWVSQMEKTKE